MTVGKGTETLIADYEIHAGGGKIPPEVQVVMAGIEVDLNVTTVGMFSLLMHATEKVQDKFAVIDGNLFQPGNEIKIKVGYGSTLTTLMVGEITALSPEYPNNGAVVFRVTGFERLYRLGFGRKTRSFRNMKDSDIAAQIAQDWRLTPQVEDTRVVHGYVLQHNQTDREFLTERARRLRYEVRVEDRSLFYRPAREDASKITSLTYGENLIEFFPRLSTLQQTSKVEVRGWSVKEKKAISAEAGKGEMISTMAGRQTGGQISEGIAGATKRSLCGENVDTNEEAEALARAALNLAGTEFITGEGSCLGNPDIKAGSVVELLGLGERFRGLYYVVSCIHRLGQKGYYTSFTARRSAT